MLSKLANVKQKQKTLEQNHVWCSAGLDRGWGVDHRRGRWRFVASLDESAVAADQRLVRAVFGDCGMCANWLAP